MSEDIGPGDVVGCMMVFPASETPTSPKPDDGAPGWTWRPNRKGGAHLSSAGGYWERPPTPAEQAAEPEERRKDAEFVRAMMRGQLRHVGNGNYE